MKIKVIDKFFIIGFLFVLFMSMIGVVVMFDPGTKETYADTTVILNREFSYENVVVVLDESISEEEIKALIMRYAEFFS